MNYTRKESEIKNPVKLVSTTLDDVVGNLEFKVGFIQTRTSSRGSDYLSIMQKIKTTVSKGSYDLIVGPEYSFVPKSRVFGESEKDKLLAEIISFTKGHDALVVPGTFLWQKNKELRNTAYFVKDGEVVYSYDKMRDGGERGVALSYGLSFILGTNLGCFDCSGIKFGVEICADAGILADHFVKDRDLVLLLSCGNDYTWTKSAWCVINDGHYLHGKVKVRRNYESVFIRNLV